MLTVELDEETKRQLGDLVAKKPNIDESEIIKQLIKERWLSLQLDKTIVERRGRHPQHLLENAPSDLSERAKRKQFISEQIKKKYQQ